MVLVKGTEFCRDSNLTTAAPQPRSFKKVFSSAVLALPAECNSDGG
jgi:hypothetical protein